MVQGEDGKWRTMANEKLYDSKMLIGAIYRNELAGGLARLGYDIEKTHADGRFEIAGVSRAAIEAFSTRRAEIEAAMEMRGLGTSADNPRLAERAALMTRATMRGMSAAELVRAAVRAAVLAAVGDGSPGIETGGRNGRLIERMFRYTHILATALRNDMVAQGRAGELEELVRSARELQDTLRDGSPD